MPTNNQSAASHANSQNSTGRRTTEGKATSGPNPKNPHHFRIPSFVSQ
jgi:hypothetical protein